MKKEISIHKAVPWIEFNDAEGHLEGIIEGYEVWVKVFFRDENEWTLFPAGKKIIADVWIERRESLKILPQETLYGFSQNAGVNYLFTGKVIGIDGELLILESLIMITVDMEVGPEWVNKIAKEIKLGDIIMVEGVLKADIHPD
jgi:hypothetical protein